MIFYYRYFVNDDTINTVDNGHKNIIKNPRESNIDKWFRNCGKNLIEFLIMIEYYVICLLYTSRCV